LRNRNEAPAALILPAEFSKNLSCAKPSAVELLTDPGQWQALEAIKVVMLLADRETASLDDPFSQVLADTARTQHHGQPPVVPFPGTEQSRLQPHVCTAHTNLHRVDRTARREVWNTSARLSISPITPACLLGGKVLARVIVGTAQLLLLLTIGHLVLRPRPWPFTVRTHPSRDRGRLDDLLCRSGGLVGLHT
jgi:hypothetical protein